MRLGDQSSRDGHHSRKLAISVCAVLAGMALVSASPAFAAPSPALTKISSDPFTDPESQHQTSVEPDSFAYGQTVVAASMSGRFFSGGGANGIAWAASIDGGATWAQGLLPDLTTSSGGQFDRVTDPVVAYDAVHDVWMISTSAVIFEPDSVRTFVVVSRSQDAIHWSDPVVVAELDNDKEWMVCDNGAQSPFRGSCYLEWTTFTPNRVQLSVSHDGGATWGPVQIPVNPRAEIGGQTLVQPDGTVIMPLVDWNAENIVVLRSLDGGATWKGTPTALRIKHHDTPYIRGGDTQFISAEVDGAGRIYAAWSDCRFRKNCSSNDIVMSTTTDGIHWSAVKRIPIDEVGSNVDHLLPGLGADPATSGSGAHIGLVYYSVESACSFADCRLRVGFVGSVDRGATWSDAVQLGDPMHLDWIADTSRGRFVGDYVSTSFTSDGRAHPVFSLGIAPSVSAFDQAIYTPTGGLPLG